jgi:DNA-binding winged helix-turn-helix (wHTH) protein
VNYLRRKLEDPPPGRLIRTVRGHGYMVPREAELTTPAPAGGLPVSPGLAPPAEVSATPPAVAAH